MKVPRSGRGLRGMSAQYRTDLVSLWFFSRHVPAVQRTLLRRLLASTITSLSGEAHGDLNRFFAAWRQTLIYRKSRPRAHQR